MSHPPCQIAPPSVQRQGCRTHKMKFVLRFDQNAEYKRPAEAHPLVDYHKFYRVCTTFRAALAVKIWLDLLEGLWSYGNFKVWVTGFSPNFSVPPRGETVRQIPKRFRRARTHSRSSITMPSMVELGFHAPPGWPKTFSFLSVCLTVSSLHF